MTSDPKLPVFKTAFESYRILGHNFWTFLRLAWIPYLATVGAYIVMVYPPVADFLFRVMTMHMVGGAYLLVFILLNIAFVPAMTSWHRMIVLDGSNPANPVRYKFRKAETEYLKTALKFVGFLFLLSIPIFIVDGIIMTMLDATLGWSLKGSTGGIALWTVSPVVIFALFFMVAARISLIFPAIAIGQPIDMGRSYILTQGQTWRFCTTLIVANLPLILAWELFSSVDPYSMPIPDAVIPVAQVAIVSLFYPLTVGVVSLAYRHLALEADTPAPAGTLKPA